MKLIPRGYFLDGFFDDLTPMVNESNMMKCDIYEQDNEYKIEVDIPGFDKKDIDIQVNDDYLTIVAKKESETKDETKKYIHNERRYGKVERSFYLKGIDQDNIKAKMDNGTLYITIPKQEEKESKKVIEIE